LAVLLTATRVAYAQGPADSDTTLPEVKVSADKNKETGTGPVQGYVAKRSAAATKTDTPLNEVPQSLSVVTAERIASMDASTIREALGYTPGVMAGVWGTDSRYDWLSLRGFDAYSPGFYVDGLLMRNIGTWGVWQTDNYGAERIEILRGPASVLYGQGSPGGMVNIVTKRPQAETLRELQLQIGDHARRQVAGDFTGPIDSEGKWLYRVTGLVRDAEVAEMGDGLPNDRVYFAPSLTWRPSTDTTLTLQSHVQRVRTVASYRGLPQEGTVLPNPNGPIPTDVYPGEPSFGHWNQDQWMVGWQLEHRVNDTWTLRQNARHAELDLDYRQLWVAPWLGFVTVNASDPSDPANFRRMQRVVFGSVEKARTTTIDNQVLTTLRLGGTRHTLLFGLDLERTSFDQVTRWGGSAAPVDLYAPVYGNADIVVPDPYFDGVSTVTQTGLYVQDQIKWAERWVATIGGRWDHATIDVDSRLGGSKTEQTDRKFSGRAGVVYLAPHGLSPYLSYAESFTPQTTIDLSTGKPFSPETGRQWEAGLRWQPSGSRSQLSAAVFDLRRQNYVTTDSAFIPHQAGEVASRGLELEALFEPLPRLNLHAAYTWLPKVEVTKSSNPAEIGKQLQAVPEHQASAWADYRFASGFKAGAGFRHVGSTRGYQEASLAPVPAYTLIDAMVGYLVGPWDLALNARNLTDKVTYGANCNVSACQYNGPRKVTATATYRW
jgi:iron complex outermembrane receptor protein